MFKKEDAAFDEMAADPIRRRAAIANLSWRRTLVSCVGLVMTLLAMIEICSKDNGAIVAVFSAVFATSTSFKMESDLRLLRFIERLQKGGDEQAE